MNAPDSLGARLRALSSRDDFVARHIGPSAAQQREMLDSLGFASNAEFVRAVVPPQVLLEAPLALEAAVDETQALAELRALGERNELWRSFIGAGYHGTILPEAIRRNVLENPGWYTAYTPYQAEIAQGRLEALLNFQQMVIDLTGLPIANASLLDEATAAAEAMAMARRASKSKAVRYFVERATHPQVVAVLRTRAERMGIELRIDDAAALHDDASYFGAHLQTPDTFGRVRDFTTQIDALHAAGARVTVGCDPLALMLLRSPGAMGADIAIGSAQRFGVPLGYGGPHAAFLAAREDLLRTIPGRIIGVSRDAQGRTALRMALQTREQHIRREKATSNICTAQALLANIASFYAVWHGPEGLRAIAQRVHALARLLAHLVAHAPQGASARESAPRLLHDAFFDTLAYDVSDASAVRERARAQRINLREYAAESGPKGRFGASLDETTTLADVADLAWVFTGWRIDAGELDTLAAAFSVEGGAIAAALLRTDTVLAHPVFERHHSEAAFVRYLKKLENRDLSLVHSMIPLGSCTMKLNAAAEMAPISWPEFANLHPYAPPEQALGYRAMLAQLGGWLGEITGFAAVSFQPNSGAQGEYAGLLAIRRYLESIGQGARDVCLVPASAHGTNPASAQMMGMRIVVVGCDEQGNVDLADLARRIGEHRGSIAALMITWPSTHGVFEPEIVEICRRVHEAGGQVYLDGANLNAQAGLTKPALVGADVCHMNLHKTFCIPHGGGGPGMGPIAVAAHLAAFLPDDPFASPQAGTAVSAAACGSALITTISWMYIRMMGAHGIRRATETAMLSANYVARQLEAYFPVLFRGANGLVAHECILDLRTLKATCGVSAEDVAKRLMDYGFHAPTVSFPVADTLMIEPTESEPKDELDRFCDAMIAIHGELQRIANGELDRDDNPLRGAPHTAEAIAGQWTHRYSREEAAYPLPWVREAKFWPSVARIDNAAGDRHLVCTCPPLTDYE
ncbi:MAG: aminomethyl-transferring glycine dehydrogenase [Burkholderiaceae bacterium]|nr:aminomethyl-transferring glycine dehydrogenase [Burkholderiaceae bacterium]